MQLTKGAIGNLINRYKAVLKKCHLMNTFGSLAVAGMLVMGGAGMATAADDMALGGVSLEWSGDADHLMGGNLYKGNVTVPEVTTPGDISLSIKGGTIEEIIGGSYVSGNNDQVGNVTLGNISTTIQDGSSTEFVVGGSKISNDADATLATGKTSLTINGGTFGKEGKNDGYELVMGGNYVKTGTDTKNTASAEGSRVTVNDGTFHASVVGGSVAHRYNGNNSIMVEDNGSTSVVINGGTFSPSQSNLADSKGGINLSAAVIGGGLAYGGGSTVLGSSDNPVTSSVTINDGTINGKIVAGSAAMNGSTAMIHGNSQLTVSGGTLNNDLIGGGFAENAYLPQEGYSLNITGDTGVSMSGGTLDGEVIGGSYIRATGTGKVANSSVAISGGRQAAQDNKKAQYVIGGNKAMAYSGSTTTVVVEETSSVSISGKDTLVADGAVLGGGLAKATDTGKATSTVNNSLVSVKDGTLAGVIGGGMAETYSIKEGGFAKSEVTGASSVAISGGTINQIQFGAVDANDGALDAAIVGGGMANDANSTATVGSTNVTISAGTILGKVVAGGAAANGGTTTVKGDTFLSMTGGTVKDDLVGGNLVDGSASTNTTFAQASDVKGSTHVSLTGGNIDGEIVGGSYVRNANATANVEGDTYVTVSAKSGNDTPQAWVQYVIGGGKAMAVSGQTATTNVDGSTHVLVEGGAAINFGTVAGGGLARSQGGTTTANVSNSNVEINGGTLAGVAGGGIAESYGGNATANVGISSMPNVATLVINEGTINKIKYGDTTSTAAVVGGGIAWVKNGVTGSATANISDLDSTGIDDGIVNTVITGGNINGDVYAGGIADGATAFATVGTSNLTIKGGTFTGNIYAGGLSLAGGTVTTYGPSTVTFDGYDGFTGTVDGTLSIPTEAGDTPPTSTLVFKNYNSTFNGIAKNFSHLNVADGSTLKLQTLSTGTTAEKKAGVFNNKALTLAGAGNVEADDVDVVAGNSLSVKNGTLTVTNSLKSAKEGNKNGTEGINVSDNGVLRAANKLLVKNDGTLVTGSKLYLGQGGTLAVTGLSSISTVDMQKYHNALVTTDSTGLIKYEGTAIEVSATDKINSGNLTGSAAEKTGALLADTTVEYGASTGSSTTPTTTINGSYGAKTVLISNADNGDHTVDLKGDLTLLGDGKNLITVNKDATLSTVTVNAGNALNLGSAAAPSQGGNLGAKVTLGNKSSLNAVAGDYTVGDVTGGTGAVTANTGANLNTGNISVNAVTADAANIKATGGDITADTVTLKNNGLLAASKDATNGGNITINNKLSGQGSVVADKTLTLGANYTGAADDVLTLQAGGDITAAGKDLKATGGKLSLVAQQGTITANNITATNVVAKALTAERVSVEGGSLLLTDASTVNSLTLTKAGISVADLTVTGGVTMTDGSAGMIDKLDARGNVTIGKTDSDGVSLVVKEMTTKPGTTMTFDPDWGHTSNNAATEKQNYDAATDSNAVNNALQVGRNSYVALGTTDKGWLPSVVQGGLREGGVETVLGLAKSLVVQSTGSIELNSDAGYVAGSGWASATNAATFGANSLLVVNGANIYGDKAAITFAHTGGGKLTVDNTSRLVVTDAVAGQTYTIVGNVAAGSTVDGWKNNGMTSTTDMISLGDAKFDSTGKKVTTSAVRNDAHTVFPNLSDGMANAVNDLYTGRKDSTGKSVDYADVNSVDMGVRFLSRATDNRFLGMDKDAAAATIESAARIAFAGAVPQMTKMASDAGTNAVVNRLGFADPADGAQAMDADGKIVDRNTTGFALWIAPLWQSQHGWGMDADSMDYGFNGNLGGVSLGADYTFENAIRAGITFNIGGGYAESSGGDLSSTDNRMNFWGLGAYAGWNYENFGVMADVSYTSTWNQLKQDVDSRMGMGDLEADVQATAISAGLRAEYLLQTSAMDIIPHIGVRYMSLNTWGYDVDTHGGTVLEGDSLHQDIWTFPIGVTFSKDFALDSGWSFKPSLDFTVIPAAGDIKAKHDVHFTGLPGTYEVETQMMDYLTWQGGVGLELANDNMSIGVNYTLQAGQHTTGHGVFGSFRYEF